MTRSATRPTILQPGRNCWRVERARRFLCVQDGADYFRLVRQALLGAERTVFILGWDIAGTIDLLPGEEPDDGPTRFDELINVIARRKPRLRCYILIWDFGSLYALERDPLSRWRFGWRTPRRVRFGYDDRHPVGASHHQKVVVVDDSLAFSGSLDLTGHRWDTTEHLVQHPYRTNVIGQPYGPYHEVQSMLDGPAAAALGELARDRWRALGARRLPRAGSYREGLWPGGVEPDLADVDVAIARTWPAVAGREEVRECEALFVDAIAAAERTIYIENQYFTNRRLAECLARRLVEQHGPEVIVATPKDSHGWLETNTMGAFREQAFRDLTAADAHGRLRLVCPVASRAQDVSTFIHSKVMVVDDTFLRIGSANCSNRSMGMDTECDVAVEACGDAAVTAGIRRVRDRLVADHAGLDPKEVRRGIDQTGSLRAFIDVQDGRDRGLVPFTFADELPAATDALRAVADPDEPIGFGGDVERVIPAVDVTNGQSPLAIWILPAGAIVAAGLVANATSASELAGLERVQHALASAPHAISAMWIGAGAFMVAAVLLVPLEVLMFAAGLVFGPVWGVLVALTGSIGAAAIGYGAGWFLGPARVARVMSRRAYRSGRQLQGRGVIDLATLQLSRVAGSGAIHLLGGAGRIPFATFLAGSLLGALPVVVIVGALGGLFRETILEPSLWQGLATVGATVLFVAAAAGLRTILLIRQFAPAVAHHRERTSYG